MIYEASPDPGLFQSYLKIKSIANLISISTDYGLITFFKKSKD